MLKSSDDCQSSFKKQNKIFLIVTIHWTVSPLRSTVMSSIFSSTPLGSAVMSNWHHDGPQWESSISANKKVLFFSVSSSQVDNGVNRLHSYNRKNVHRSLPRQYHECCCLHDYEFFLWTFVFVCSTGHDCWVCTQSPIWSRFDCCVPSFYVWEEPLIHVIRTVRVAAVLSKDRSLWISIYLSYRTWLHWHRTPLNAITLTDKETQTEKRSHQAKNAMRRADEKIYILSPIQQDAQSHLGVSIFLFYSIRLGRALRHSVILGPSDPCTWRQSSVPLYWVTL